MISRKTFSRLVREDGGPPKRWERWTKVIIHWLALFYASGKPLEKAEKWHPLLKFTRMADVARVLGTLRQRERDYRSLEGGFIHL